MNTKLTKLSLLLVLFSAMGCTPKKTEKTVRIPEKTIVKKVSVQPEVKPEIKTENLIIESFSDSTQIGTKGNFKVTVDQLRNNDSTYVVVHLFEKRKNKWSSKQKLEYLKDGITNIDPKLEDFNNDGFKDLTFQSSVAARGANEIRKLLVFDPVKKQFILMKNAENYPNLQYNKLLNCVDAWMVYGGSSTVFLKIEKDSLREFAGVSLDDNQREIYVVDKKGNHKTIKKETVPDLAVYIRYKNYHPLIENSHSD
ncbi:XAC2610-related protein [Flavobacterium sp. FlaQc-48]|uniref:XAC2610-related protein n=1 Tax=Flavobacterium sp. FlaQc-48 TaxID=3374181 RepID=UPI00375808F7